MPESTQESHQEWILQIVDTYECQLLRYAARLLSGDSELAMDVVQHAFLKLCQQDRSSIEGHVAKWLYMVCRNRAFDELRKRGKDLSLNIESENKMDTRNVTPEQQIERKDFVSFLHELIGQLPLGQREALELWAGGLKYEEVASVIGKSEGSIRVLVHRGIQRLKAHPEVARWLSGKRVETVAQK